MKSKINKRIVAFLLCMVLVLSGGASSLVDVFNADEMNNEGTSQDAATQSDVAVVTDEANSQTPETPAAPEAPQAETPAPAETTPAVPDQAPVTEQPATEAPAAPAPHQDAMELTAEIKDAEGNVVTNVKAEIPDGTFAANTAEVTMEVTGVDEATTNDIKGLIEKGLAADKVLGNYFFYNINFKVNGQVTEPTQAIKITFEQKDFKIDDVKKANTIYYNPANSIVGNTESEIIEIAQKVDTIEALQAQGQSIENIDDYDLSEISLKEDGMADKIMMEGRRSTVYGCYLEEQKPEEPTEVVTDETKKDDTADTKEPTGETNPNIIKQDTLEEEVVADSLSYEDSDVTVTVSAAEKGIIPEGATLRVTPILPETQDNVTSTSTLAIPDREDSLSQTEKIENELLAKASGLAALENKSTETNLVSLNGSTSEYEKVKSELEAKAANEDYDIAGFLAYDISFINADGNEVEPNGDVKVVIDYKQETVPESVDTSDKLDVTVMHLEENKAGAVKDVVDMVADGSKEAIVETTNNAEVKKAEFITDSFSYYTVTWYTNTRSKGIKFYYYDQATSSQIDGTDVEVDDVSSGTYLDLTQAKLHPAISGKEYVETRVGTSYSGSAVATALKATRQGSWSYQYKDKDGKEQTVSNGTPNVYLVYKTKTTASNYTVKFWRNDKNTGGKDSTLYTLNNLQAVTDENGKEVVEIDLSGKKATASASGYAFYGWALTKGANLDPKENVYCGDASTTMTYGSGSTADTRTVFTYDGSSSIILETSKFTNKTLDLYGIYAVDSSIATTSNVNNTTVEFYIRYDGVAPYEPGSYDTKYYADGITVNNALYYYQHIYNSVGTVAANLKNQPSTTQIENVWDDEPDLIQKYGNYDPDKYYVEWYVVKKETTWHVDGVVRERSKWRLAYSANCSDTVENIIGAKQYDYSNTVTVNNTNQNGVESNTPPVRLGYNFINWNTSADGTGITFSANDSIKINQSNGHIIKNGTDTGVIAPRDSSSNIYSVTLYAQWQSIYEPPVIVTENELSHEKYIKDNKDGSYDLTLNVSGAVGSRTEKIAVDILLILDTSGSMKGDNLESTQEAVKTLTDTMAEKGETVDSKWKIVRFSNTKSDLTSEWVSGSSANSTIAALDDDDMTGGTNYQKGFEQAIDGLNTARSNAEKVVIFLTDGQPTYYGSDSNTGLGDDTSENTLTASYNAASELSCNQFYAVGIGLPDSINIYKNDSGWNNSVSRTTSGLAILEEIKNKVTATKKDAINSSTTGLSGVFEDIAGRIDSLLCTNVTIEDTLTDYVDVIENTDLVITVKDKDEHTVVTGNNSVIVGTGENAATITASYDSTTKKIVLDFPDNYELQEGYTYYVTAKIKPTDKAFAEYAQGSYPNTGDEGTDAPDNNPATSAGKGGFFSNTGATVTYTYNEETKTEQYKKPVVQVNPERVSHRVDKEWVVASEALESVNVTLKAYVDDVDAGATSAKPLELTHSNYGYLPESMTTVLSSTNSWTNTWTNLPKYYYYTKDNVVKKAEIRYTAVEVVDDNTDDFDVTIEETTKDNVATTVITNTRKAITVDMQKYSVNDDTKQLTGAKFSLFSGTVELGVMHWSNTEVEGYKDFDVSSGKIDELSLSTGYYKLQETLAPAGYIVLSDPIYLKVANGVVSLINADGTDKTTSSNDMWSLDNDNLSYTLKVDNNLLYSLPETGGMGIYWYMIGGLLLMLAAALILYKNKNKGVLIK